MIKPINDFVLIAPTEEVVDPKSIILMNSSKEKPQTGTIVSVGEGRLTNNGARIPLEVVVGDKVIYSKYAGSEITHDGEVLLMIREMDILAVIG